MGMLTLPAFQSCVESVSRAKSVTVVFVGKHSTDRSCPAPGPGNPPRPISLQEKCYLPWPRESAPGLSALPATPSGEPPGTATGFPKAELRCRPLRATGKQGHATREAGHGVTRLPSPGCRV